MPTNANGYNTRLTDESLEQRFRNTFRSQSGAELVDDLYASGVIVPVVDFTAAAEGSSLREDLQTAWDFSTDFEFVQNQTTTLISTAGFWQIDVIGVAAIGSAANTGPVIRLSDGLTQREIWKVPLSGTGAAGYETQIESKFVVFVDSGQNVNAFTARNSDCMSIWYRQIADLYGNLVNPQNFQPQ